MNKNTTMDNISSTTVSITATVAHANPQLPRKCDQIVPLDFHSLRTHPETHVWPPGEVHQVFPIPVIDFSRPCSQKLIVEACEKWGVFQLTNNGIPPELLTEVEAQGRLLFSLPASQKLKALRSPNGASGYTQPLFSHFFEKHMWNEAFIIIGSPADHAAQLWPDDQCQVFCDVIEDYKQRMTELAAKLLRLILESLNTSEKELRRISSPESTITSLQLNSYPPCPDPTQAMGLAPHTDTALISLVNQGNVKGQGLQIFGGDGEWGMVPPVAGALTVNVGDLLNVISNGRFHTVRHRVVIKEPMLHRVSVTLFYYPKPEFVLSPVGDGSGDDEAPMNRWLTVKQYRELKFKKYHTAVECEGVFEVEVQKLSEDAME